MPFPKTVFTIALLISASAGSLRAEPVGRPRLAIIKADDVRGPSFKWNRFIGISLDRDVVVSLGVITESMAAKDEKYLAWLRKWEATGKVEFWNHGWDHKAWKDASGKALSEFGGSGLSHQREHLEKSQSLSQTLLGKPFAAFGSPFNAMDADTAQALNEIPSLKFIFCYPDSKVNAQLRGKTLLPMNLRGEHEGTGKPHFEKFKADYQRKDGPPLNFAAIQFHPASFPEDGFEHYANILDFLKAEGWTFVLPGSYTARAQGSGPP
jgi:peptidoglycan/xylan/chitin deacetylase (PgdA/CDA1 family)